MLKLHKYSTPGERLAFFEEVLPRKSMFLIDGEEGRGFIVVYRSLYGKIEYAFVRRHQKSQWQPDFKIFIEGEYWGDLNGKLFDDLPALAAALRKRGLEQVEL